MRLENKVAIITGSSRGIGKAIALAYAKEGAKVILASRKQEQLDAAAEEIRTLGAEVTAIATNTGYEEQCQALVNQVIEKYSRVDILVNNAATNPHFGHILDAEAWHWEKTFNVNINGYFWMSKAVIENMQQNGGGKIVNMASVAGIDPGPMMGVYSISKAAVIMMTKVLAQELGGSNIQVNAIAPGIIKTKFAQALWDNPMLSKVYTDRTPAGRIGTPEEITGAAVYLASADSSYQSGTTLVIDGGNSTVGF